MFTVNYDEMNAFEEVTPGEYEVIIKSATRNATPNGKEYLDIQLQVRNDVVQKCHNGMIFHKIWKKNEPTAADPDDYVGFQINQLSKACMIPNNAQIPNLDTWLSNQYILGRPIKVKVVNEPYNGKDQLKVAWLKETAFPNVSHQANKKTETPTGAYQPYNQDTPFTPNADGTPF